MIRALVLALALGAASAFTPAQVPAARSAALNSVSERLAEGAMPPTGFFDPWGFYESGTESTNAWFRAAELKHGRVCMAAFTGFLVQSAGIHFPGALDMSGKQFSDMPVDPAAAWGALSWEGQMQIIGFIGFVEFHSELRKPHVLSGGIPGKIDPMLPGKLWDPLGMVAGLSEEKKAVQRTKEIANSRAAMLGMMGILASYNIPDSVPMQFLPTV